MKIYKFRLRFNWNLLPRVQLTICGVYYEYFEEDYPCYKQGVLWPQYQIWVSSWPSQHKFMVTDTTKWTVTWDLSKLTMGRVCRPDWSCCGYHAVHKNTFTTVYMFTLYQRHFLKCTSNILADNIGVYLYTLHVSHPVCVSAELNRRNLL